MSYEDEVHSNWTNAVSHFTHYFLPYESEVVAGLKSHSSEVRCASIAILNQCNSVLCRNQIFEMLQDDSEDVVKFVLEYLWDFGKPKHAKGILALLERFPFEASMALNQIIPNKCNIIDSEDSIEEKRRLIRCWEKSINDSGN